MISKVLVGDCWNLWQTSFSGLSVASNRHENFFWSSAPSLLSQLASSSQRARGSTNAWKPKYCQNSFSFQSVPSVLALHDFQLGSSSSHMKKKCTLKLAAMYGITFPHNTFTPTHCQSSTASSRAGSVARIAAHMHAIIHRTCIEFPANECITSNEVPCAAKVFKNDKTKNLQLRHPFRAHREI